MPTASYDWSSLRITLADAQGNPFLLGVLTNANYTENRELTRLTTADLGSSLFLPGRTWMTLSGTLTKLPLDQVTSSETAKAVKEDKPEFWQAGRFREL